MKNLLKGLSASFVLSVMLFISCQHEESEIKQSPKALTRESELTSKLSRIIKNDTRIDNFIDNSSAFSYKLPFSAKVNGQDVTVNTIADYDAIKAIFNASTSDVDTFEPVFPLTLLYSDYSERIAHNHEELDIRLSDPVDQDPITCVQISYPFSISVYDSNLQSGHTVTIHSSLELFGFIASLNPFETFQINYPLLALENGVAVSINSNENLLLLVNSAIDNCGCNDSSALTTDLILDMPFSNELDDLTGFSVPTITGNYHFVTDRSGNPNSAISFDDGANNGENSIQTYQVPLGNLMQNNNFTMSLWYNRQNPNPEVQVEQMINSHAIVLMLGNDMNNGNMGPWMVGGSGGVYDPSWAQQNLGSETGVWHHLVVTYQGGPGLMSLYRDGVYRASYIASGIPSTIIGLSFGNVFKGYMDDIRGYKRALTQSEITTLYTMEGDTSQCHL